MSNQDFYKDQLSLIRRELLDCLDEVNMLLTTVPSYHDMHRFVEHFLKTNIQTTKTAHQIDFNISVDLTKPQPERE
jgi:hypothetical protein